ncbi:SMP-30/gluconolactonase/LRE family protein [Danxiaibacter flavus]|uniref:SMP-30/gluconolactonase/LRE family protein n=1 Tax=Danxiaibacter flavus TaxID=3049108 RepID=A0ABV3ZQH4_9BACT|nr:SMP-30/gluconolactonase/LRE family protein [Chitinophagaceae bacterium DXS]
MELTASLILDARAELAEGPIWNYRENKLYWVDIDGRKLHIYDPETKEDRALETTEKIGTVVPMENGDVLVALQSGIHQMNTTTGELVFMTNPLPDPEIRFNDGKCDPSGRFWVGSMHLKQIKGKASLYRMDADDVVHQMLDNVTISNGIAWSADKKTMYYVDTPTKKVDAFDYDDAAGNISNRRTVIHVPEGSGSPDGMTIDEEGMLWTALWGDFSVARWNPLTGELLGKVTVPVPQVSACAFGGKDLSTLYITTARENMSKEDLEKYPLSGSLFAVDLKVKGVKANFYKG